MAVWSMPQVMHKSCIIQEHIYLSNMWTCRKDETVEVKPLHGTSWAIQKVRRELCSPCFLFVCTCFICSQCATMQYCCADYQAGIWLEAYTRDGAPT